MSYDFSGIWGDRITDPCAKCRSDDSGYPVWVKDVLYWLCKECDTKWQSWDKKDFVEYIKSKKVN